MHAANLPIGLSFEDGGFNDEFRFLFWKRGPVPEVEPALLLEPRKLMNEIDILDY